MASELTKKLE
jgi:26S proteasome regulatory subunit N6